MVVKGKIPIPCWELNPSHLAHNLVTILTELSWAQILIVYMLAAHRCRVVLFISAVQINRQMIVIPDEHIK
jgi:hypothetical protein